MVLINVTISPLAPVAGHGMHGIVIPYPASASGIIVTLKTAKKYQYILLPVSFCKDDKRRFNGRYFLGMI